MTEQDIKLLRQDPDGLATYEYLANNIDNCSDEDLDAIVDNMTTVDRSGQFTASAARYLHAIDTERYAAAVERLVASRPVVSSTRIVASAAHLISPSA